METLSLVFALLVVFQVKHFLADYILQGRYMLGKFKPGWDFLPPLLAHVGVHAAFTALVTLVVVRDAGLAVVLAFADAAVHFVMDRVKAGPKYLGRWSPTDRQFWWALGFDQGVHHLTHYGLVYVLAARVLHA